MTRVKKRKKSTARVIPLTERRREAMELVKFIDVHGGKLAPFRAYQQVSPPSVPPVSGERV
jgi:hypothetical protein